jgi:hypothetical protein
MAIDPCRIKFNWNGAEKRFLRLISAIKFSGFMECAAIMDGDEDCSVLMAVWGISRSLAHNNFL